MTTTDKPVRRRTRSAYNVLFQGPRKARPVVVSIQAGDILRFREHGRRDTWDLAIDTAFKYAVRLKAFHDAAKRHAEKQASKGKAHNEPRRRRK